jgi:hypothetical protein
MEATRLVIIAVLLYGILESVRKRFNQMLKALESIDAKLASSQQPAPAPARSTSMQQAARSPAVIAWG